MSPIKYASLIILVGITIHITALPGQPAVKLINIPSAHEAGVSPQQELSAEEAQAAGAACYTELGADGLPTLAWPLEGKRSDYSWYKNQWNYDWSFGSCGGKYKKHNGLDINNRPVKVNGKISNGITGTQVFAAYDGVIKDWGSSAGDGWAQRIIIEHTFNGVKFTTSYLHIVPTTVGNLGTGKDKVNTVKFGQLIGTVAHLAKYKNNDHLHFTIRKAPYEAIAARGALPSPDAKLTSECKCNQPYNDPVAPEKFIDPAKATYSDNKSPAAPYTRFAMGVIGGAAITSDNKAGFASSSLLQVNDGETLTLAVQPGGSVNVGFDGSASSTDEGTISDYKWQINDSVVNNQSVFSRTLGEGIHNVALTVTNNLGFTSSATATVAVTTAAAPQAVISMTGGGQSGGNGQSLNYTVAPGGSVSMSFNATGSIPGSGSNNSYEWRSNGTVISNLPSFTFPFAAASHTITLKVTNNTGLSNTATSTIVVSQSTATSPQAMISMSGDGQSGGNGQSLNYTVAPGGSVSMSFNATGSIPGSGSVTAYEWRSNGTVISNLPNFTFAFGAASHTITLKVTNSNGLSDTKSATIVVRESTAAAPQAVLSMSGGGQSGGNGQTLSYSVAPGGSISMSLNASGSVPGSGSITSYEWRSNGTVISNLPSFTFAFGAASHTITLKVTNSSGLTGTATATIVVAAGASPAINSISPTSPLSTFGDQGVTVNGGNFQPGLTVTVTFPGGGSGTLSGSQIQNVTASSFVMLIDFKGTAGAYSVRVKNPDGAQSNAFSFTAQPASPSINAVSPVSPTATAGNQNVTVTGSNFKAGLTVTVTFPNGQTGGLSGAQIQSVTASTFVMVIDFNGIPGGYAIRVNNPDGKQSNTFNFTVAQQVLAPVITSVSPASPIASSGDQAMTVTGDNFQAGLTATIFFPGGASGTLSGAQIQSVTSTSFVILVDFKGTSGAYSVRVNNPSGRLSNVFGFTAQPQPATPSISSISPASPVASSGDQGVNVSGSNFQSGLTVTVLFPSGSSGTLSGTQIQSVTSTSFTMLIDFKGNSGTYSIRVNNPDGRQSNVFSFTTQPQAPSVSGISPASPVATTGNQNVTVNGSGFRSGLTVTVTFPNGQTGTLSGTQIQSLTATAFVMVINFNGNPGNYSIQVNNSDGTKSAPFSFTVQQQVLDPAITSMSPSSPVASSGDQPVTVNGSNFQSGLTVTVFFPGGGSGTLSGTQIQSVTGSSFTMLIDFKGTAGVYSIRVNNPNGRQSNTFAFTAQAASPSISGISPSSPFATSGNQSVTVSGSNFKSGLTVTVFFPGGGSGTLSGTQIQSVTSSSFVMLIDFKGTSGTYTIRVNNPDSTQSNSFSFNAQGVAPSVNSISPSSPVASSGDQGVTVFGSNFQAGLTVTVFFPGGGSGTLSGTQIQSVSSTSFTMLIDFKGTSGTYSIRVNNPDGRQSNTFSFNATPASPSVSSISPASPSASRGNQNVSVFGSNFKSGLTVTVFFPGGGSGTLSGTQIQSVSSTSFVMVIDFNGNPGTYSIRVNNSDGTQSNTFSFSVR